MSGKEDKMLFDGHSDTEGPSSTKGHVHAVGQSNTEIPCDKNERTGILAKVEKEKKELRPAEQNLFSKIQITLGYYSLLRNVDLIWTAETTLDVLTEARFAIAELVYLLAFRINMLFVEISCVFPALDGDIFVEMHSSLDDDAPTTKIRPVIFLYAAEILVRGLEAIGAPEWNLRDGDSQSPLLQLEKNLSQSFQFMVNHLRAYECHLSGWYNKRQRTFDMPGLLAFVRAAEKGLPNHLIVAVQRHTPWGSKSSFSFFDPFPLLQTQWSRYSTFDLFSSTPDALASAMLSGSAACGQRVPEFLITEHNSRFKLSKFKKFESHDSVVMTTSSTGGPGPATEEQIDLCHHPDPPRFCGTDSSTLALAGLHLRDSTESPNTLDAPWINFVPPERWEAEFRDAREPSDGELQVWEYMSHASPSTQRKRKQGERSVDGHPALESGQLPKRRELAFPANPGILAMYFGAVGEGTESKLTEEWGISQK
ncbi:hypothetical protein G647_08162 [Cladophialophora carrionii CBS 160.54]|uniref:Uncharacterized protein n=1 Tax=Cladophialophora carrionii CBS 160.54 TaxID=1279043 RepID=V9D1H2_9EURO|nr:uncharacterized protein G647_08162 [Cladophialophora carrionii CBS 160.54]ETI20128.1 hypothetical protein G647_08162 [Cladophialophora carrionii CBS 160.54]